MNQWQSSVAAVQRILFTLIVVVVVVTFAVEKKNIFAFIYDIGGLMMLLKHNILLTIFSYACIMHDNGCVWSS